MNRCAWACIEWLLFPQILPFADEDSKGPARAAGDGIAAILSHKGDLVYVAMPKGLICVISVETKTIIDLIKVAISASDLPPPLLHCQQVALLGTP